MALAGVIKPEIDLNIERVTVLIYGMPGLGKTTLASTAGDVLLIDADESARRAALLDDAGQRRCDVFTVRTWADVAGFTPGDFDDYSTVVVDTVGGLVDMLAVQIAGGKSPSVRQWGEIKSTFGRWIDGLRSSGKDIVYIAHGVEKQVEDGDNRYTVMKPQIAGSSLHTITRQADLIGRLYASGAGTVLSFNPALTGIGKNCARIPDSVVRNVADDAVMMQKVISRTKEVMSSGQ